jgi:hypothetical protein
MNAIQREKNEVMKETTSTDQKAKKKDKHNHNALLLNIEHLHNKCLLDRTNFIVFTHSVKYLVESLFGNRVKEFVDALRDLAEDKEGESILDRVNFVFKGKAGTGSGCDEEEWTNLKLKLRNYDVFYIHNKEVNNDGIRKVRMAYITMVDSLINKVHEKKLKSIKFPKRDDVCTWKEIERVLHAITSSHSFLELYGYIVPECLYSVVHVTMLHQLAYMWGYDCIPVQIERVSGHAFMNERIARIEYSMKGRVETSSHVTFRFSHNPYLFTQRDINGVSIIDRINAKHPELCGVDKSRRDACEHQLCKFMSIKHL